VVIFGARLVLTVAGSALGTRLAGSDSEVRSKTWKGLVSQGGVSLGLLLILADEFPSLGEDVVALGMAVVIGNILAGPILLKSALVGSAEDA
jgi:hypothetical protein